jgi:SAM-dependent methyltransferase
MSVNNGFASRARKGNQSSAGSGVSSLPSLLKSIQTSLASGKVAPQNLEVEIGCEIKFTPPVKAAAWKSVCDAIQNIQSMGGSVVEQQQLDVVYSDKTRRRIVFVDGVNQKKDQWIVKKTIASYAPSSRKMMYVRQDKAAQDSASTQLALANDLLAGLASANDIFGLKIKASSEEPTTTAKSNQQVSIMRAKRRWSVILDGLTLEIDLVKQLPANVSNLKDVVSMVFAPSTLLLMELSHWTSLRIEVELPTTEVDPAADEAAQVDTISANIVKASSLIGKTIGKALVVDATSQLSEQPNDGQPNATTQVKSNDGDLQRSIFQLARTILPPGPYRESFRSANGLKRLMNNVIDLSVNVFRQEVQPLIYGDKTKAAYFLTDKADGKRTVVHFTKGVIHIMNDSLTLITPTAQMEEGASWADQSDQLNSFILDCEQITSPDGSTSKLYIFDCLEINGDRLWMKPTSARLTALKSAQDEIIHMLASVGVPAAVKTFVPLVGDHSTVAKHITEFYSAAQSNVNYSIDGLIFTPDEAYFKMTCYKWKPNSLKTIDFYVREVPESALGMVPFVHARSASGTRGSALGTMYVLMVGVSKKDMSRLNIAPFVNYDMVVPKAERELMRHKQIMPIQFSPSSDPNNFIWVSDAADAQQANLSGKIVELGWDSDNSRWIFHRVRTDRDGELARGDYYGNYYSIAELTWQSILNPLTFENLTGKSRDNYFQEDDNQTYRSQRAYNSYVKTTLLKTIFSNKLARAAPMNATVVDLASGKGQDLTKLMNLGVANALFMDVDKDALEELVRRKHNTKGMLERRDIGKHTTGTQIFTLAVDLTLPWETIKKEVTSRFKHLNFEQSDLVVCNFAFHYLCPSRPLMVNVAKLVHGLLKPGGRFLVTCFDGKKVANLLQHSDKWIVREDGAVKYNIQSDGPITSFVHGKKIKLLLPFSKGELIEESLVDLSMATNIFGSNGFTTEAAGSFADFQSGWGRGKQPAMSEGDIVFTGLYSYMVFQKNMGDHIVIKSNMQALLPKGLTTLTTPSAVEGKGESQSGDDHGFLHYSSLDNMPQANAVHLVGENADRALDVMQDMNALSNNGYRSHESNKRLRKKIVFTREPNSGMSHMKDGDAVVILGTNILQVAEMFTYASKTPVLPIIIGDSIVIDVETYRQMDQTKEKILSHLYSLPPMSVVHI